MAGAPSLHVDKGVTMQEMENAARRLELGRRSVLKGIGFSALGLMAVPALASCSTGSGGGGGSSTGSLTFGSNASDEVPKKAYAAFVSAFEKKSKDTVKTNTVDHNGFQNKINNYLQGSPDDAFTWFAGYRMVSSGSIGCEIVWKTLPASSAGTS
jgi:multiple sugar transport system substrate-binding protein